jgi:glycosyltransferase involved in cell wall biosynthesis
MDRRAVIASLVMRDERTTLAFVDGFMKPAAREAHGTAQAAFIMCEALAQHGGYTKLHLYRERGRPAADGELAIPSNPPTRIFDKTALYSSREPYGAIYVANGSQMRSAPHHLRPPHDWAPVVCSIGTAHASNQWANLFVSLTTGALRASDGIIFKALSLQTLFRQAWEQWQQRFAFTPAFPLTTVIANGVDVEANKRSELLRQEMRQRLRLGEEDVVFLGFSRLSPATKGDQQALIVRWKDVLARVPRAFLLLSGAVVDRAFVADLRALARAADVASRLLVLDNPFELAADARSRLMSAADVFVHLSTGVEEASPMVVHEAMAHSLPVIATSWAGIREVVTPGQTGFLVETRNAPLPPSLIDTVFGQGDLVHLTAASRRVAVNWPTFIEAAVQVAASECRQAMGRAARKAAEASALPVVARAYRSFFDATAEAAERTWTGPARCRPLVDLDQIVSAQATRRLDPEVRIRLCHPDRIALLAGGLLSELPGAIARLLTAFETAEEITFGDLSRHFAGLTPTTEPESSDISRRDQASAGRLIARLLNFGILEYA